MSQTAPANRRSWIIVYTMIACYLLLATTWMGISWYDDSMYMDWVRWMTPAGFKYALAYDPLYVMWFKALGTVFHDPIWRYMVNWGILVAVVTSIPLWFRNRLAWLYAVGIIALAYFGICDYVSVFAAMILLTGLSAVLRKNLSLSTAIFTAFCLCFVTAYVRPEYQHGVFISSLFVLATIVYEARSKFTATHAVKLVVVVLLVTGMYDSVSHSSARRSGCAFAQHTNLRAWEKGIITEDPWNSDYAERLYHVDMEHHANVAEANIKDFFRASPRMFFGHVADNLKDIRTIRLIVIVFVLGGLPFCLERYRHLRPAAAYLFLVSVPVMIIIVLIYPRPHYVGIVLPPILLLALQYLDAEKHLATPQAWKPLLIGLPLMFLTVYSRHWYLSDFDSIAPSNNTFIHCVRDVEKSDGVGDRTLYDTVTIDADDVYFPTRRTRLFPYVIHGWPEFTSSMQRTHPAWIILGPNMTDLVHQSPAAVAAYLEGSLGYQPHACPASTGVTIYTQQKR